MNRNPLAQVANNQSVQIHATAVASGNPQSEVSVVQLAEPSNEIVTSGPDPYAMALFTALADDDVVLAVPSANTDLIRNDNYVINLRNKVIWETDSAGKPTKIVSNCIGHIVSIQEIRNITEYERQTGKLDRSAPPISTRVTIKIMGIDRNRGPIAGEVVGGPALLSTQPSDWYKHGDISPLLLNADFFPPMHNKNGKDFTQLLKITSPEKTMLCTSFTRMGWLRGDDGFAIYLTGNKAIDSWGETTYARPMISEISETKARNIDVELVDKDCENRAEKIREDIAAVLDAYLGLYKAPGYGELILAAALRPTLPVRPETTLLMVGPPSSGKSFAASYVMSGWQPKAGTWDEKNLPGQATDTKAYTEIARSACSVWVSDDIAPSTSEHASLQRQEDATDLIRSQHNGSAKGRSSSSGKAQVLREPNSQFVITSENGLSIASANQRVIQMNFYPGIHDDKKSAAACDIRDYTNALSRVNGYLIEFIAGRLDEDYIGAIDAIKELRKQKQLAIRQEFVTGGVADHGEASRFAGQAADLVIALETLAELAASVDLEITEPINRAIRDLVAAVGVSHAGHRDQKPGAAFVDAAGSMIATGKAYLKVLPAAYEAMDSMEARYALYESCGYAQDQTGEWVEPRNATRLGYVHHLEGVTYAAIELTNFRVVQRFSDNTIPHGTKGVTVWKALKVEGFTPEGIICNKGNTDYKKTIRVGSTNRECAPVNLEHLLAGRKVSPNELD